MAARNIESSTNNQSPPEKEFQRSVALLVLGFSIGGLVILSAAVVYLGRKDFNNAQYVFAAVVPLIGTWVGTVLAFYFTKENFESTSRSLREMAEGVSGLEKLKSIPVTEAMLLRTSIVSFPIKKGEESKVKLAELKEKFHDYGRMPLLDRDHGSLVYLVYKSEVDGFLADRIKNKRDDTAFEELTLQDLMESGKPGLRELFSKSFGFVEETATLAKAKAVMDAIATQTKCEDVFVTKNGNSNEEILGWIMNNDIARYSKV